MATQIDTKQIAERVKKIRHEQEHYFPEQPNEPTEVELCGYVEHLLDEKRRLLFVIAGDHINVRQGEDACECRYCTEHRELSATVGE